MRTSVYGRRQPGGLFSAHDVLRFPGEVWWVGSAVATANDTAGYGQNPDAPFATLAYAESRAAADDTIIIMPGHVEVLVGSPCLLLNVASLHVVGLGGWSRQPVFVIDGAAAAYVSIAAADIEIENVTFSAGHADIASAIVANAVGANIHHCKFIENVATENFLICVLSAGANVSDGLQVNDCWCNQPDASNTHFISHPAAQDSVQHSRNVIHGEHGTASIGAVGVITNCRITDNEIFNSSNAIDSMINLAAGSTGLVGRNAGGSGAAAQATQMTAGATAKWENYFGLNAEDLHAVLDPIPT